MIDATDQSLIDSKYKAITAFIPYTVWWEQVGQQEMFEVSLDAIKVLKKRGFVWHGIESFPVATLLSDEKPTSLKQAVILMLPHLSVWRTIDVQDSVQLWAAAASAVPYTDEVGQSVVDTLLQIAYDDSLQPHIPIGMWSWLNKCPSLPPICTGRYLGSLQCIVQIVQGLRDIEILTSYLLLIWSEWDVLDQDGIDKVCTLIREDFSRVEMGYNRKQLLQHLEHVLGQLGLGLEHLQQYQPYLDEDHVQTMGIQYRQLKEVLLEVDGKANDALICESQIGNFLGFTNLLWTAKGSHLTFMCAIPPL